ncbi:lasso peptide biosynthesis B2 protein [Smaragdicoccus niigatensis]|uniref:lasso peptide biosynthesis B2 protein n=1 Tax=Smaragdicoccus niigatensis TaxID=359359 RepID=UPI0009DC251D
MIRKIRLVPLAARILARLLAVEIGLRITKLPSVCRLLRIRLDMSASRPASMSEVEIPGRFVRAVNLTNWTTQRWPWGDTCLRRCLVLAVQLRDLEPVVRIGVTRDARGAFLAHSWLEISGQSIDPMSADFVTLTRSLPTEG